MKLSIVILAVVTLLSESTWANGFLDSTSLKGTPSETVVESIILDSVTHEEPLFARRGRERDVAQIQTTSESEFVGWQEGLVVMNEIPYSYAQISRRTLQARVLNELEAKESKAGE